MASRALQKVNVPISLDGGIGAGQDPIVSTKLLKVENGIYNRMGAIEKRNGIHRYKPSTEIPPGINEIFQFDNSVGYVSNEGIGTVNHSLYGALLKVITTDVTPVKTDFGHISSVDYDENGNVGVVAYLTTYDGGANRNVAWASFDTSEEGRYQRISEGEVTASADPSCVRVVNNGDGSHTVFYIPYDEAAIGYLSINSAGYYTDGGDVNGTSDFSFSATFHHFDAIKRIGANNSVYHILAYRDTDGYLVAKYAVNSDYTTAALGKFYNTAWSNAVTISRAAALYPSFKGNDHVGFVWAANNTASNMSLYAAEANVSNFAANNFDVTVATVYTHTGANVPSDWPKAIVAAGDPNTNRGIIFWQYPDESRFASQQRQDTYMAVFNHAAGAMNILETPTPQKGLAIYTKPVVIPNDHNSNYSHLLLGLLHRSWHSTYLNTYQETFDLYGDAYYTAGYQRLCLRGKVFPGETVFTTGLTNTNTTPSVFDYNYAYTTARGKIVQRPSDNTIFTTPVVSKGAISAATPGTVFENDNYAREYQTISLVTIDTNPDIITYDSGDHVYCAGSMPFFYDGKKVSEIGYACYPEPIDAAIVSGGALTANSNYNYVGTYEFVDTKGYIKRSPPSTVVNTISTNATYLSANVNADVTAGTLFDPLYSPQAYSRMVLYRKLDTDLEYRRVMSTPANAASTNVLDVYADSYVNNSELLYTSGGVLESSVAPSGKFIHKWDQRQWIPSSDDGYLYYSRYLKDYEHPCYNESLYIDIDTRIGKIVALQAFNDRLVVFAEGSIHSVEGEGFNDTGGGQNYRHYLLSNALGCANPRSIVRVPQGIMFEATDGMIWLLGDNLQLQPIGNDVKYYTDTYTISKAVEHPTKHWAMFFTSDGPCLVYNWLYNKWSTFTNHSAKSACVVGGVYYFLNSNNEIWAENPDSYADVNSSNVSNRDYVSLAIETGWINPGEIHGRARLYEIGVLGYPADEFDVRARIAWNYDPTWDDNVECEYFGTTSLNSYDYTDYYGNGLTYSTYNDNAAMIRLYPSRTEHTSFRIRISDEAPTNHQGVTNTKGLSLVGLVAKLGIRQGMGKTGPRLMDK